jgi:hypothetical protein
MTPPLFTMISGQFWSVIRCQLESKREGPWWGECDEQNRQIRIDERVSGVQEFDTAIHEYFHAAWPFMSEDEVRNRATELTNLLELIRYRNLFETKAAREELY